MGVQGLADAYLGMRYAFDSPEAALLNRQIFETLYHAGLEVRLLFYTFIFLITFYTHFIGKYGDST
jgi:hypothetical protein